MIRRIIYRVMQARERTLYMEESVTHPHQGEVIDSKHSPARTKRAALDEFMWTYHDRRHTGQYSLCPDCTTIWGFFNDNPKFNIL